MVLELNSMKPTCSSLREDKTTLLTVYGNFTIHKTAHNEH
jgi:hypothetical protein